MTVTTEAVELARALLSLIYVELLERIDRLLPPVMKGLEMDPEIVEGSVFRITRTEGLKALIFSFAEMFISEEWKAFLKKIIRTGV